MLILKKGISNLIFRKVKERVTRLLTISADDMEEVHEIGAGNIGAVVGMKACRTGDTLVAYGATPIVLPGVMAPESVFSCSVEAESTSKEKDLRQALMILQVEDPSLLVTYDEESGQTVVSCIFFK